MKYFEGRYDKIRETYGKWWAGELERPIVPVITTGHSSWRGPSPYPELCFENAWDFSISPEQFVDAHDYRLSTMCWYGDAFPCFPTTVFGPGVVAAFMGCTPMGRKDTVWFKPPRADIPIEELHFEFNAENPYLRRVLNLYEAAMEKWRGSVIICMTDLGGTLDILASFRGSENLLMDLYDAPEEVHRCIGEIHEMWFRYFDMINGIMAPEAAGYSQWMNTYSEKPGYILQSDFSYMISPGMFDEFVAPELAKSAARLSGAMYHMDGMGQIPHLNSLLSIDGLKGIQWVPGAGAPESMNWDNLLKSILDSGKKLLSWTQRKDGMPIDIAQNPGQLYFNERSFNADDIDAVRRYCAMFGIEID